MAPYTCVHIPIDFICITARVYACVALNKRAKYTAGDASSGQEAGKSRKVAPAMFRAAVECWNLSPSTHSPATGDTPRTSTKRKKVAKRGARTRKTYPTD